MKKRKRKTSDDLPNDVPMLRARGMLLTEIDCPHCRATFHVPGKRDDVVVGCDDCGERMVVRLL